MIESHKNRKYWGWGSTNVALPEGHLKNILQLISMGLGIEVLETLHPPLPESIKIDPPAFEVSLDLSDFCTTDHFQRLFHTYGQSYRDVWRSIHGIFEKCPDYVAFPTNEDHIRLLFEFADLHNVGLIIFGGGTSVVGGVEMPSTDSKTGFISIDMSNMDKVLEINEENLTVKVQAGILGPALEKELKAKGLVLRHYPQSFEFSSVGGWVATRAGGHYATVFTQIDHFVQNLRLLTPTGVVQTRQLPNSGAGPNENRYFCGSEGIFGIITEITLKVQKVPQYKQTVTVRFNSFEEGMEACRQLSQSQLYPSNARLVDPLEALANNLGDGMKTILILGYESPAQPVDAMMQAALRLCLASGGEHAPDKEPKDAKQDNKADDWKRSFLLAPYLRDEMILKGLVVETFETCTTWSNFPELHRRIKSNVQQAIINHCGTGMVTCRFTHLYPDGPAPYYTVVAQGKPGEQLKQWDAIKKAASEAINTYGGTITHHHSVGRDHQPYFEKEQSPEFLDLLRKMKDHFDPDGLLNEGVLIK